MTASAMGTIIKDSSANPAPLGLMGFGMTTIMLSLHNAGLIPLGAAILAMGILFGGLAQLIAGLMEWKKGNTFGMTVFASFGFFWLIIVMIILAPKLGIAGTEAPEAMAALFFLWGLYSAYLTVGTVGTNRVTQAVFVALTIVLLLLSASEALASGDVKVAAGCVGVLAGALAVYSAMAQVLNEALGREVVPVLKVARATKNTAEGSSAE
ncbi:MAG: acetate uptake transporter [Methanomassiliicoccus sp.]|nr:acetate uptake transporter [Methanomassiliicoccus sp.]